MNDDGNTDGRSITTTSHRRKRQRRRPQLNDDSQNEEEHLLENTVVVTPLSLLTSKNQINHHETMHASSTLHAPLYLRVVKPYPHTFTSFCKARWIGRTVLDVYCTEFGSYPSSYYTAAIQQGRIRISHQVVPLDYRLQGKDILLHTVHRHEPAVLVSSDKSPFIALVEETSDLLAVDKPSTIPIHPCGGYHRNSLMNVLQEDAASAEKRKLYTIHRLDRLTSGLVVLAKTSAAAQEWGQAIQRRDCRKVYLARVKGRFGTNITLCPMSCLCDPSQAFPQYGEFPNTGSDPGSEDSASNQRMNRHQKYAHGYWMTDAVTGNSYGDDQMTLANYSRIEHTIDEWMHVLKKSDEHALPIAPQNNDNPFVWFHIACPVRIEQPKIGVCAAGTFLDIDDALYLQTVKPAHTAFGIVRYCPKTDSTILIIQPMTGRTHQIRVHLQYLGHSIANDPNYGGQLWFGNPGGQQACREAQDTLDQMSSTSTEVDDRLEHTLTNTSGLVTADTPATEEEVKHSIQSDHARRGEAESISTWVQRTCVWCSRLYGATKSSSILTGDSTCPIIHRAMLEFLVRSPGLWLHAYHYKVNDQAFSTTIPRWCQLESP